MKVEDRAKVIQQTQIKQHISGKGFVSACHLMAPNKSGGETRQVVLIVLDAKDSSLSLLRIFRITKNR